MNQKQLEDEFKNFAYNIKCLRLKNNLSINQMADKLNIDENTLIKLENGEISDEVTVEVLFLIHKKFGISPKNMFGKSVRQRDGSLSSCENLKQTYKL